MTFRLRLAHPGLLLLAVVGLACGSCGLLRTVTSAPSNLASSMTPSKPAPKLDSAALAARMMRFADFFAIEIQHATVAFATMAATPEARIQALAWRIDYTDELCKRATVEQPYTGLFDSIVMMTTLRVLHEEHWIKIWGAADQEVIEALKRGEAAAWKLAGEGMTPEQLAESRKLIESWMASDPSAHGKDVDLPSFDELMEKGGASKLVSGLTDLVKIDPMQGLEPTTREIRQARALAERFFFFAQRLPEMLEARVELLTLRSAGAEQTRTVLESVERVSRAAESISLTAEALPAKLSAERSAALEQVSKELDHQREGLIRDMQTVREPLTEILGETRGAAESTRALADSLTPALQALGLFLDRFKKDEKAPVQPATEPATPSRPFDITEYGVAAERIGAAVREVNATLSALDERLPEIRRVVDETAARSESTIDYAWRRMLELLLAALVGAATAVLAVRWISLRWKRTAPGS